MSTDLHKFIPMWTMWVVIMFVVGAVVGYEWRDRQGWDVWAQSNFPCMEDERLGYVAGEYERVRCINNGP